MNDLRARAHAAVAKAVWGGALIRQACSVCGTEPAEAHHEDYSEPLDVIWLCRRHHAHLHRECGDYRLWGETKASRTEARKEWAAERLKWQSIMLTLPLDLIAKIDAIAGAEDRSRDSLVEIILNDYAEARQAKAAMEAAAKTERKAEPTPRDIERLAFEGHISMQELCRRADVHPTTFRHWKSGRSTPSVAIVQALLDAGWAAATAAERAEAKAVPTNRRPRAKAKTKAKAAPVALRMARRRA